jgi:deoxyhypusine synthase
MKKNSNKYLKERVKDIEVEKKSISKLMSEMADTGFQGRKIGEAVNIWERMIKDKNVTIFMGLAGSMSTTGQWRLIKWLMENRFIDVLVSTGANISEDIQDSLHGYYKGHWIVDDADLLKNNIFRYYDVFTDGLKYRKMTELIREFLNTLKDGYPYSSREFCQEFGKFQLKKNIDSLLSTAYRKNIPVYSPAIMDSEYGIAAVIARRWDKKNIVVDQMKDFEELAKIGEKSKKTGVIYIGGGVPKDTIQLITAIVGILKGDKLEFPHSYAIQITTDSQQWGGLSGCTFEEAVSWGKITKKDNDRAVCYCDATIALPIILNALNEKIQKDGAGKFKRKTPDFSWLLKR